MQRVRTVIFLFIFFSALSTRHSTLATHLLPNHSVREREHVRRKRQANLIRRFEIDDELELSRLLDRKIGGLRPSKILSDQVAGAPLKSMKATVPTGVENSYFS